MPSHPLARLTSVSRERLIRRHLHEGLPLKALAVEAGTAAQKPDGYSLRSAYKWLARYRTGGVAALADRRSVRRTQRRTLDPQQLQQAVDLRHQRCTLRCISWALKAPLRAAYRVMNALGLGRLRNLDP
jgi:transposase